MSQQSDHSTKTVNKWRDKYLDLIDQYDQLEKNSESKQDQMRRALVVVSLLAEGQAESIDKPLSSLREAIKPHNAGRGLEASVEVLQAEVARYEKQWQLQADEVFENLQKASKNLLSLPCSADEKRRIKKILSKSKHQLAQWAGYKDQLNSWAKVLADLNLQEGAEAVQKQHSEGFFSRLFNRSDEPSTEEMATKDTSVEQAEADPVLVEKQVESTLPDHAEVELLASETTTPETTTPEISEPKPTATTNAPLNTNQNEIEKDISDMLNRLLTQLVVPSRYLEHVKDLKERLSVAHHWLELIPILEQVSNLIIEALGNGQEEFEQFLQGLDHRLETIQHLINNASQGQVNRSEARTVFEDMLEGQVNEIRTEVSKKSDLGDLGNSISEHLGLIVQAMQIFSSAENDREAELTKQLSDMQRKLNEMEKLANGAQHAIEEQRKKAMHDSLTGLPNRESYQQRLEHEVQRMIRYQGKLSLVVADIDLFKRINDSYGHLAGDKVLKIISRSLQKNLRDTDFIARFGGEEFVILMPETSAAEAKVVAEKLRKRIESSPFNFKKEPVQITTSFGLSEFHPNDTADEVFERADKALYHAKGEGRNRVLIG